MLEQEVIPKKKKELPRTVLRERVLIGESEGNCILPRLYGFRRMWLRFKREMRDM